MKPRAGGVRIPEDYRVLCIAESSERLERLETGFMDTNRRKGFRLRYPAPGLGNAREPCTAQYDRFGDEIPLAYKKREIDLVCPLLGTAVPAMFA